MDFSLSYRTPFSFSLQSSPSNIKPSFFPSRSSLLEPPFNFPGDCTRRISLTGAGSGRAALRGSSSVALAAASGSSECGEFGGLNTPVQPKSASGKLLSGVLLNDPGCFPLVAKQLLEQLVVDRHEALARMNLSSASDDASFLRRRIAKLKECECKAAAEDVMYMLICSKFNEIKVHLVPQLSKCMYNGRLEIWPSKDWELESIHSFEVLEMVREHVCTFVSWRANSNVTDKWMLTEIPRLQLCQVYTASVLYGYFLKSASLRHTLEKNLSRMSSDTGQNVGEYLPVLDILSPGSKAALSGPVTSTESAPVGEVSCSPRKKLESLRCYIMGFNRESLQKCAKPRSKEAANLIERQISALFRDQRTGVLETSEAITTSFGSLKRFVLEGVAFGSFLWDAEDYVSRVYDLEDNY